MKCFLSPFCADMVRGCSVLVLLFCHQVLSSPASASPGVKSLPDADQEQQENENEVDSAIDYHHQVIMKLYMNKIRDIFKVKLLTIRS